MIKPQNDPNGALYAIYLELAGRYHPDVVKGPRDIAEARFREIERAYEVMRDALREAPHVAAPKQNQGGSLGQNRATVRDRKGNVEILVIIAFLAVMPILLGYWIIDVWHRIADSSRWQTDPITMSNPPPQVPIAREQKYPPQQLQDSSNFQPVPSAPPPAPATQPSGGSQLPGVRSLAQQPPSDKSDPPNARALRKHDSRDDRNSQVLKRRRARAFRANRLFAIDGCAYW
jgi:curved DNA-binding protein CbpA